MRGTVQNEAAGLFGVTQGRVGLRRSERRRHFNWPRGQLSLAGPNARAAATGPGASCLWRSRTLVRMQQAPGPVVSSGPNACAAATGPGASCLWRSPTLVRLQQAPGPIVSGGAQRLRGCNRPRGQLSPAEPNACAAATGPGASCLLWSRALVRMQQAPGPVVSSGAERFVRLQQAPGPVVSCGAQRFVRLQQAPGPVVSGGAERSCGCNRPRGQLNPRQAISIASP